MLSLPFMLKSEDIFHIALNFKIWLLYIQSSKSVKLSSIFTLYGKLFKNTIIVIVLIVIIYLCKWIFSPHCAGNKLLTYRFYIYIYHLVKMLGMIEIITVLEKNNSKLKRHILSHSINSLCLLSRLWYNLECGCQRFYVMLTNEPCLCLMHAIHWIFTTNFKVVI